MIKIEWLKADYTPDSSPPPPNILGPIGHMSNMLVYWAATCQNEHQPEAMLCIY